MYIELNEQFAIVFLPPFVAGLVKGSNYSSAGKGLEKSLNNLQQKRETFAHYQNL